MNIESFYLRNLLCQPSCKKSFPALEPRPERSSSVGSRPDMNAEEKRSIMVHRVAREVFENMIATDNKTVMAQAVQLALTEKLGKEIRLRYLPGRSDIVVFCKCHDVWREELSPNPSAALLEKAWQVTLDKVEEAML